MAQLQPCHPREHVRPGISRVCYLGECISVLCDHGLTSNCVLCYVASKDELHALVDILHAEFANANLKKALDLVDTDGDGKIDYGKFK